MEEAASDVRRAVDRVLAHGWRTADIARETMDAGHVLGTIEMGEKLVACIEEER